MTHRQPQGSAIIDRGTAIHLPPERLLGAMHWPDAASKCKCESRYEQDAKSKHCNSARVIGRQFNLARFSKSGNSLVPKWRARPAVLPQVRALAPHRIKPHVSHRKWHQMGDTLGPADLHSRTFPQSGCGWYAALAAMARRVVLPAARSSVGTLRDNLAGLSFAPPDILERLRRHHRVTHRVGDAGVAKDVLLSVRVQENLYLLLISPTLQKARPR